MPEENLPPVPEAPKVEMTPSPAPEKSGDVRVETKEITPEQVSEKSEKYQQILNVVAKAPASDEEATKDAAAIGTVEDTQATVEKLVVLAETKGVSHAVAVARKLNELYVLDTLHDTLSDNLSEALIKKGLIQAE